MKGSMLIEVEGHTHVQISQGIDIEHDAEKVLLLHAFCDTLDIDMIEVIAYMTMKEQLSKTTETVRIDASAIRDMFGRKDEEDDSE